MAQAPAAQQDSGGGNDMLWIAGTIVVVSALLWYERAHIIPHVLRFKLGELYLLSIFDIPISDNLLKTLQYYVDNPLELHNFFAHQNDNSLSLMTILNVSSAYFTWPLIILLCILAIYLFTRNVGEKFKKTQSMHSLLLTEQKIWPHLQPVVGVNIIDADIDAGIWASAMNPMIFAKKHKLLIEKPVEKLNPLITDVQIAVDLIEDRARNVFYQQIGPPFAAVNQMPAHRQALFAVFAAFMNHDRKGARKLLLDFNKSVTTKNKKPDFAGYKQILDKYLKTKVVQRIIKRHAYELTVMASMLELARTDGVVTTAEFIWLKPLDRQLWYVLSNVGRKTAFTEVAGPISHWLVEKRMQRKLVTPMLDEAVKALKVAVKEVIYQPDEVD